MQVVNVEQNELINSITNDVIIFNKETQSYFKKDGSITLTEDTTFRDAILGQYKPWSRWREKIVENDFTKYYDNNDETKILEVYNEIDALKANAETRVGNFNLSTIIDTIDETVLSSFNEAKTLIDTDYLSRFDKLVYVNQTTGNDMNIGGEFTQVKTIRRAEELIIENTGIIIQPGVYDITTGNNMSNRRYCVSGLAGNYDDTSSLTVEYINMGTTGEVKMIVDTQGIDWEARDITFINGIHNVNSKVVGIVFKMIDAKKETTYSVSIARGSEGIQLIDCVFDLDVLNGNIVNYKITGRDSVVFKNCLIDFKKVLTGPVHDVPFSGTYELDGCFINDEIKNKLQTLDSQNTDIRGSVSLISTLNTTFFTKN